MISRVTKTVAMIEDIPTILIYLFLGVLLERSRIPLFLLAASCVVVGVYCELIGADFFHLSRGVLFYCIAYFLLSGDEQSRKHGVLTSISLFVFSLLAVEDWLYNSGMEVSFMYDNFEIMINAIIVCHILICFDDVLRRSAIRCVDYFKRVTRRADIFTR